MTSPRNVELFSRWIVDTSKALVGSEVAVRVKHENGDTHTWEATSPHTVMIEFGSLQPATVIAVVTSEHCYKVKVDVEPNTAEGETSRSYVMLVSYVGLLTEIPDMLAEEYAE